MMIGCEHFRYWHLAYIQIAALNVRFRGDRTLGFVAVISAFDYRGLSAAYEYLGVPQRGPQMV
jgi:hypothetical protein